MPGRERAILPFCFVVGKQPFVPGTALANHLGRSPLFIAEGKNQENNNKSAEYEGNYPEKVRGRISQVAVERCQAAWTAVVFGCKRARLARVALRISCGKQGPLCSDGGASIRQPVVSLPCVANLDSRRCEAHAASALSREVGSEKGKDYRVRDN